MNGALILATWIHSVAFVAALGYYAILGLVVVPGLRDLDSATAARTLDSMERRALPIVLIAVVLFVVTGSYLLTADAQYLGLGNVAASTWTEMLTIKHLLIIPLVGLGIVIDSLIHTAGNAPDDRGRRRRIYRVQLAATATAALGAAVILVTAIAQHA